MDITFCQRIRSQGLRLHFDQIDLTSWSLTVIFGSADADEQSVVRPACCWKTKKPAFPFGKLIGRSSQHEMMLPQHRTNPVAKS